RTAALPFPGGIFSPLRAELLAAAAYGIPDAVPYSAVDAVPAGLNSEDADAFALAMRDDLVSRADTTLAVIAKRLDAADEALTRAQSGSLTADQRAEAAMQAGKALFGDSFRAIPLFAFHNPAEVANAYAGRAGLLAGAPALAVDEWLQGVSLVRPKAAALETLRLLAEAFDPASAGAAGVTVMQLPHGPADRWLALPFDPSQPIPGDKLSILLQTRPGYDPAQPQGGLILDEWTEVIPRQEETTGIAFHFNRPNAEAPNALLLAIAPDRTGAWRWQDLVDCLHETLELAKQRAVEPDHIDRTAYAQLLPATVSAVARGLATISLNLSANLVAASLVYKTES
ncbi:MAG: hypothetical protein IT323_01475, partial [Anaerolineae bacterium]|nr:hypothetical protein [Anaerolineae bacterium]